MLHYCGFFSIVMAFSDVKVWGIANVIFVFHVML